MNASLRVKCPFCTGAVLVLENPDGLAHTRPECEKFIAEDADVFIRNMRIATVGHVPEDTAVSDLHPTFKEALALHESFRRLRFEPDDIYVRLDRGRMFVTIKRSGKEFNALAGPYEHDMDTFASTWTAAASWWNGDATENERKEIYENSKVMANSTTLVASVIAHGFSIGRSDA